MDSGSSRFGFVASRHVVQVDIAPASAELAADVLWRGDPSAVAVEEQPDGLVRLTANLTDLTVVDHLPEGARVAVVEPDEAAQDSWRAWAAPMRAGRTVVLQPSWAPPGQAQRDDVVVMLDPGRTFGSGSHVSTRLCVGLIEDLAPKGARVLDVGTGSGVLAIVACVLGAESAVAIDVDAAVLEVVPANAARNGCVDRIRVSTDALRDVPGQFDLVLANIGVSVLRDLAADLEEHVAPDGLLVLAGLLDDQAGTVLSRLGRVVEVERRHDDGWVAVALRGPR